MKYSNNSIPANRPDLIGIVPIFELQNLKKLGHFDFLGKKNKLSLGNKVGIFDIFVVRAVTCWYALFTRDVAS